MCGKQKEHEKNWGRDILIVGGLLSLILLLTAGCSHFDCPLPMAPTSDRFGATSTPSPAPSLTPTAVYQIATRTPQLPDTLNLALFEYDPSAPLGLSEVIIEQNEGNFIHYSVTYQGKKGCRVLAYLVTPDGPGPYPAVIYLHRDMGHGATFKLQGNKDQFLEEAKLLAGYQVASLMLDSPFLNGCGDPHDQRDGLITQVVDVRRGIDYLEQLSSIDPDRIGFVGHSYGATVGGIIAGVEKRIKTFVLMGGHAIVGKSLFHITNHIPDTHDMEPYLYIGQANQTPVLFMFAKQDQNIAPEKAELFYDSANAPKEIIWYDTDHYGLDQEGQEDRLIWLGNQLGFDYP